MLIDVNNMLFPFCRTLNAEVKPILTKMLLDTEFDVRYYAEEAKIGIYMIDEIITYTFKQFQLYDLVSIIIFSLYSVYFVVVVDSGKRFFRFLLRFYI